MLAGKMASQLGHAYVGAFQAAQTSAEGRVYATLSPGTKVALQGTLQALLRAQVELEQAGIPHYLVVDSGCPDFFDGQPTITALGFGPALKSQTKRISRRFQLL